MRYVTPAFLFFVLLAFVDPAFPNQVAAKCKGEAFWAIRDCACTVVNRLEAGIAEETVLNDYYADPIPASPVEVTRVRALLLLGCPEPYYYMFSLQDVHKLGIQGIAPLKISPSPTSGTRYQVWFYEKEYRNRNVSSGGG